MNSGDTMNSEINVSLDHECIPSKAYPKYRRISSRCRST